MAAPEIDIDIDCGGGFEGGARILHIDNRAAAHIDGAQKCEVARHGPVQPHQAMESGVIFAAGASCKRRPSRGTVSPGSRLDGS
jgi:hypothetical protein